MSELQFIYRAESKDFAQKFVSYLTANFGQPVAGEVTGEFQVRGQNVFGVHPKHGREFFEGVCFVLSTRKDLAEE